jgi:hypothetical protein
MTRIRMRYAALLALPMLAGNMPNIAAATEHEAGLWMIVSGTDTLQTDDKPTRWRYWYDVQARFYDPGSGTSQYILRPGIGYDLNDNVTAWAGYARIRARSSSGSFVDENRYWQQLTWTAARWQHGTLTMRLRLEERSVSSGDDLGLVLRYSVKYTRPIGASGRRSLVIAEEPFVALRETDWAGQSGLRQNRLGIGIAWRLSPKASLETSYMNIYSADAEAPDRMRHLAVINLKTKF